MKNDEIGDDWFTKPIHGLDDVQARLLNAMQEDRLPSAYLFSGMEGIGKATLATRFVASLLAPNTVQEEATVDLFGDALTQPSGALLEVDEMSPVLTRMQQGSHPDFLWIRPPYDEKKQVFKKDIPIERIRTVGEFMALTAGEGGWKVVLIDSADAMNQAAANALLKWLEEPPKRSLFILLSHASGKLLPTIRSRCRTITIPPPSLDVFSTIIGIDDATHIQKLYHLTGGSPGIAMQWDALGVLSYWDAIIENILTEHAIDAMFQLAEKMAKEERFTLQHLQRLLGTMIKQVTMLQSAIPLPYATEQERKAMTLLSQRQPLPFWLELWEELHQEFEAASGLYLDKRHVIGNMLTRFVT